VEVAGIERNGEGFSVKHGGGELFAKSIILASGTEPLRLDLPGEGEIDGERLFYEIRPLLRRHMKPRDVVVIGGGEAACDYALTLAAAGATVHLVMRSDRLKARGMLARAVERTSAVQMYRETRCERIVSSPRLSIHVRNSATGSETELNPDAILVAVGRRSTAPRLLGAMGVSVSDCTVGLAPGLLLVGDARIGSIGQIGMAVGDGLSAAAAAIAFLERG
jgi:thioredoxin reductase (NADPH)